ncbi:MAG: hypothetical protein ACYTEZ_00400 [Planctomycetota bacterium]|jgi:type II secretory pathway component GspD/PulD (secretin)
MRKLLSLSFLLMLALTFGTACSKKQRVKEEAPGDGCGVEAEMEAEEPFAEEEMPPAEEEEGMPPAEEEEGMPPAEEEEGMPPMEEEEEMPPAEEEEEMPPAEEEEEMPPPEAEEEPIDEFEIPEDVTADKERMAQVKQRLMALAGQLYAAGELERARDQYRRVLLLDPGDEEARAQFRKISQELGERVPVAEDIIERESDRVSARRQQTMVELNRRLRQARVAEENGDYATAIQKYEEILNILNWYKYQAGFPVTTEQARALIERARAQKRLDEDRRTAEDIEAIKKQEEVHRRREKDEDLRRMKVFLQMASDAFDRGDYDLAVAHARKVLALDPQNRSAQGLVRIAQESKYVADRSDIQERFNDEWRTIMEIMEHRALPHPDILRFPATWDEVSRRRPKTTGPRGFAAPDPRAEQIRNTLAGTPVFEIDWKAGEITLSGAIQYLRSVTGLNFVLSQKVKEEKADTEIELKVDNVAVTQVLDLITEPNEMAWKVRNGVVMILGKEEAVDKPVLQFYDVKDLVAKISDFPGQEINLVPSKYQPPEEEEELEPVSPFEVDALIEVIKTTVEPESWDTIEGADIQPKNNVLVVTTTPEIHQKIGRFLQDLRRNTGLLISLEVRFMVAEDRFLRDVGVDVRGLGDQTGGVGLPGLGTATEFDDSFAGSPANPSGSPLNVIPEPSSIGTSRVPGAFYGDGADGEYKGRVENLFDFLLNFDERGQATATAQAGTGFRGANSGGLSFQHVFLDDTQLEVILRAVEKTERIEEINAPRLTVYDTQRANVSVMTQNSYVQDFDVEIAQAAAIGDPIVQTIRDGIILDVRPIVSADRRFITMELRPTVADLVRPIPTFLTSLATGPPVVIQVPEIAISRVRTTVTMPDGGTLMLGGIRFFRDLVAESGIPILSKIPIISFLFSRKAKTIQRRNLLILIKADVLVPEEHAPGLGFR